MRSPAEADAGEVPTDGGRSPSGLSSRGSARIGLLLLRSTKQQHLYRRLASLMRKRARRAAAQISYAALCNLRSTVSSLSAMGNGHEAAECAPSSCAPAASLLLPFETLPLCCLVFDKHCDRRTGCLGLTFSSLRFQQMDTTRALFTCSEFVVWKLSGLFCGSESPGPMCVGLCVQTTMLPTKPGTTVCTRK